MLLFVVTDYCSAPVQLKRAIRHVLEEQKWWGLPRYLLGSSAGGAAALLFATRFPVQVHNLCKWALKCLKKMTFASARCNPSGRSGVNRVNIRTCNYGLR